jgi:hypothetical protein
VSASLNEHSWDREANVISAKVPQRPAAMGYDANHDTRPSTAKSVMSQVVDGSAKASAIF